MSVRSDKFVVFLAAATEGPLDADSIEGRARRLRERIVEALPAHLGPNVEQPVSFDLGYALMYRDPMLRAERSIHRALDEAMFMALRQRTRDEDRRAHGLDEIIAAGQIHTLYQPILDLRTQQVVGHEIFTHGPPGTPFEEAERLFAVAERTGRLLDLERLSRARALESARRHLSPGPSSSSILRRARSRIRTWPDRGSCGWWMRAGCDTRRSSWRSRSAFPRRSASRTSRPCTT
jgi:hypothetical protein